jgi:hypothetical protein
MTRHVAPLKAIRILSDAFPEVFQVMLSYSLYITLWALAALSFEYHKYYEHVGWDTVYIYDVSGVSDRLCGPVVRVSEVPGSIPGPTRLSKK